VQIVDGRLSAGDGAPAATMGTDGGWPPFAPVNNGRPPCSCASTSFELAPISLDTILSEEKSR
jgi:hypothetical protein